MRVAAILAFGFASSGAAEAACREVEKAPAAYTVCEFDSKSDGLRLFLNDEKGAPYADFDAVAAALGAEGEKLLFAMNAGMYHKDRSPVGLYVENYEKKKKLSTKEGPGNFHLLPNGVFVLWAEDGSRGAKVLTSEAYRDKMEENVVAYATQSGPMLVIDGELHPKFLPESTSKKRRNGVGVRADGTVVFAISEAFVTFHQFAAFFRDDLGCDDALYLDGTISRLYAPELERNDGGAPMGPIVGVVGAAQ